MAYPTGELAVDLHAITENWRYIKSRVSNDVSCGAVVKANAYGLGVDRIAPTIYRAGCRDFFVSNLKEAQQLKSLIGPDADIFVLTGCNPGAEHEFIKRGFVPVIVSFDMLLRWASVAKSHPAARAVLKVNTGMGRLGIELSEFERVLQDDTLFEQAKIRFLMSHFACADESSHPLNKKQIQRFKQLQQQLAEKEFQVRYTLANSAGVFIGESVHWDIVRPGIALYGGNPGQKSNPMKPVVGLNLPIIQVRHLPVGECVGYGATQCFDSERYIAVVSGGYADGILRSLGGRGWGYLAGCKVPIVGRISMDSTLFDVTEVVNKSALNSAATIEILGNNISIDDMACAASTISYEILTSLGARYQRCYIE
ncbi:MAG: alanine racemase [Agarilytica sp.]